MHLNDKMPKKQISNNKKPKPVNLLRKEYPKEEKSGAADVADKIYNFYKNGDLDFARDLAKYLVRLDWQNKKHDMIYRVEKAMKAKGDPAFNVFVEGIKRERRGSLPVDLGKVSISYSNRSRSSIEISLSIFDSSKVFVYRKSQYVFQVLSHSGKDKWYTVTLGDEPTCTCEDFTYRSNKVGGKCKHIFEVEAIKAVISLGSSSI